jgi:hypothetical protein
LADRDGPGVDRLDLSVERPKPPDGRCLKRLLALTFQLRVSRSLKTRTSSAEGSILRVRSADAACPPAGSTPPAEAVARKQPIAVRRGADAKLM